MDSTTQNVVLFFHISFVIVSFMIAAILHASFHVLPRAQSIQQMRPWAKLMHRLEPLLPIFALFILGFGVWLVHLADDIKMSTGWVDAGITALVIIEGLAGAMLAPRTKQIVAMIDAAPDGEVTPEIATAVRNPVIWDIGHIATFGFLGVVLTMVDQPSGGVAAIFIVVGALIGVALSRWQLSLVALSSTSAVPSQPTESAIT